MIYDREENYKSSLILMTNKIGLKTVDVQINVKFLKLKLTQFGFCCEAEGE